jgi:hypothetical protein
MPAPMAAFAAKAARDKRRASRPTGRVDEFKVKPKAPAVRQGRGNRYAGPGTPKMQDEFERTLAAERREAESRASRADEQPATRGPRAAPKGPKIKAPKMPTKGLARTLRGIASRNPRRVVLAELLLVVVIVTVGRVAEGEVPHPSDYLAPFVVYLVLGFAAEVGGGPARLAMGLGGLVLLAMVMANAGGIVKALGVVTVGPTTYGAQGASGFDSEYGRVGEGTAGGGGGGSW